MNRRYRNEVARTGSRFVIGGGTAARQSTPAPTTVGIIARIFDWEEINGNKIYPRRNYVGRYYFDDFVRCN
jgi:hypothetical protein